MGDQKSRQCEYRDRDKSDVIMKQGMLQIVMMRKMPVFEYFYLCIFTWKAKWCRKRRTLKEHRQMELPSTVHSSNAYRGHSKPSAWRSGHQECALTESSWNRVQNRDLNSGTARHEEDSTSVISPTLPKSIWNVPWCSTIWKILKTFRAYVCRTFRS